MPLYSNKIVLYNARSRYWNVFWKKEYFGNLCKIVEKYL